MNKHVRCFIILSSPLFMGKHRKDPLVATLGVVVGFIDINRRYEFEEEKVVVS